MTERVVTIMVIGETGVGKSKNGCAILQKKDAFTIGSTPDSETFETTAVCNTINGIKRYYIDTQGLESTDGRDAHYIQQMIEFLKNWKLGVNAFYLVLSVQEPRFNRSIQTMIQIINDFFNDPTFWNQTGIIFTKCYRNGDKCFFDENMAKTQYRQRIVDFIKNLPGCENINPQMPCFFVDSAEWETEENTKSEYTRIFEFAHKQNPVPTQNMKVVSPDYQSKEEKILENVLVKTEYEGTGINKTKILYYENQKQYKITDRKGKVTYTKPEMTKEWTKKIPTKVEEETKVEQNKNRVEKFRNEKYGGRRYIVAGPRAERQVHDYYLDTTNFIEYKRQIITDPDGKVTFGEWKKTREWQNQTRS